MSQPENAPDRAHAKPVIYETSTSKSLFFSLKDVQSRMHSLRPDELQFEYTKIMMGFLLHNPDPHVIAHRNTFATHQPGRRAMSTGL